MQKILWTLKLNGEFKILSIKKNIISKSPSLVKIWKGVDVIKEMNFYLRVLGYHLPVSVGSTWRSWAIWQLWGVSHTLCDISYDVTFGRKFGLSNGRHLSKSVLDPLAVDKSFSASKFCCEIESNFLNFFIYFVNVQKL
jgi:hypothetical protein